MKIRVCSQVQIGLWLFYVGEELTEENLKSRDLPPEAVDGLIKSGVFEEILEVPAEEEPRKRPRRLPSTD